MDHRGYGLYRYATATEFCYFIFLDSGFGVMKKYLLLLSCIFLLSGNGYAKDLYFSRLSESAQAKVLKIWRGEVRKGVKELVKTMPMQVDAATVIDSVMFLDNSMVYFASVEDEGIRQALSEEGVEISAEDFWNDDFMKSFMKTYMTTRTTNYVCSSPELNVHLAIGTIKAVKYVFVRDNGFKLFDVNVTNCDTYEVEPIVLPNGNRLFP